MGVSRVVVMGASAGGVTAYQRLAEKLPRDFAAPVVLVQHVGSHQSMLPALLAARGPLRARHAVDGDRLELGTILVAPPDHHLLLVGESLRLSRGPKEHHTRPAVDPLFRTAALSWGSQVIGVVLTGHMDDGTAGLQDIKRAGGQAVVQDPKDAEYPGMPLSATRYVEVDHTVKIEEMAGLLVRLVSQPAPAPVRVSAARPAHEQAVVDGKEDVMEHLEAIGKPSTFVCPDCKGVLWEITESRPQRFRCHTGHGFTVRTLAYAQAEATNETLWNAIRALQEKGMILERLAAQVREEGDAQRAGTIESAVRELAAQIDALRGLAQRDAEPPPDLIE